MRSPEQPTNIEIFFLTLQELPEFFVEHFVEVHHLEVSQAKLIVEKNLRPELEKIKDDVRVVVEYPYVDKMYRNTYYHYYSSKLKAYPRDTARISFFDRPVAREAFLSKDRAREVTAGYRGFIILRPTFPKIIGRSSLSPLILKSHDFSCCICKVHATVHHMKVSVEAFPHASQDGQFITCAETTIWSILEYFSNKYSDYRPLLPSQIHELFKRYSYKRQLPSEGMTAEQIAYVIREVGFGAMFYSKAKHKDDFYRAVSMFIESGIPVIGVITYGENKGHALNIIGHVKEELSATADSDIFVEDGGDLQMIDFHGFKREFIFIDDNYPPYQVASLDKPAKHYQSTEWHEAELATIIVPLYHRIYLDAIRARKNFIIALKNTKWLELTTEPLILRVFLASSRSYKQYIILNNELDQDTKQLVYQLYMPKFIWIVELSSRDSYRKGQVDGVLLQDATEPSDSLDQSDLTSMPIFAGWYNTAFFSNYAQHQEIVSIFASSFERYHGNLHDF